MTGGRPAGRQKAVRGKRVDEILARYAIPSRLRHEKKPHEADNLSRLAAYVYPLLKGRVRGLFQVSTSNVLPAPPHAFQPVSKLDLPEALFFALFLLQSRQQILEVILREH